MAEPEEIIDAIEAVLKPDRRLSGFKALVTAGPTHEPIDPVRFIANRSSGKQGYAIASALARAGADTVLVSGPVDIAAPTSAKLIKVETARQMLAACEAALPVDIAVCTAAVADWRPATPMNAKIKKQDDSTTRSIALTENPDILATLAHHAKRPALVIGFAAETDDLIANAAAKLAGKNCDWIIANNVGGGSPAMGGDTNLVHLVTATDTESWPELSKAEVARRLVSRIAAKFGKAAA
jgi:phosphopantothenoylcysteine decarboxylase/phosphopantothenate--cysteine ligase